DDEALVRAEDALRQQHAAQQRPQQTHHSPALRPGFHHASTQRGRKPMSDEGWTGPVVLTEGPFAGWTTWSKGADPFETAIGPFCFKQEGDRVRCAFQPRREHLNGGGTVHGGALMSFADFALFAIAHSALRGAHAVTLTCNSEFLGPGGLDGAIEA